ncbi:helix-turn-helix domain-containing protein [Micromonospora maritima]|uniref:helix-turn-helix domain-containing protein n=1 Tax=Micromonospora maritima TaxID=986711 RepID=UPI00157D67A6|nr:helix-turn-helix transcriptional regulator [Micromonospora maritima]
MGSPIGPTIRRRRLTKQLRELREARGLSCEQVAQQLGYGASWLSRIETNRRGVKPGDVRELLHVYGVNGPEAEELVQLARDARLRGWWQQYDDILSDAIRTFVGLESDATTIGNYEVSFIPGLLQTEAYARELFRAWRPTVDGAETERKVSARMGRKQSIDRPNPPTLWAVIDEAVLRREVGGPGVMREQLLHLLEVGERPNINLQVIPFSVGAYDPMGSGFSVFEFAEDDPPIVYIENLGGGVYLEDPKDVSRVLESLNYLRGAALSDRQSAELIAGIVKATQ